MKKIILILFCSFLLPTLQNAQEVWSLEQCINEAQSKSINVQQSRLSIQSAEINLEQDKMSRYPNLNASSTLNLSSGRFIDPTSNEFQTTTSFLNSWNLNSNVLLYSGGRVKNSIKKDKMDIEAARLNTAQAEQDIALQVAQSYLNVLLADEQLKSSQQRLEMSNLQLEQTLKLINAGALPKNNRLDLDAQISREQQTVVVAQNAYDIALMTLKQIMFIDLDEDISIEKPEELTVPDVNLDAMILNDLYQTSYNTQPRIKAGAIEMESAQLSEEIAGSTKLPTISAFAGVSTNYSNRAKIFEEDPNPELVEIPFVGVLNGVETTGTTYAASFGYTEKNYPYHNQLWDNLGQNIGLSISYPIWDNKLTKSNIERAKIQTESIRLRNEITQQNLKVEIQNAMANAKASKKSYESALATVSSLEAAYENTQKRYKVGSSNSFELTTAKNNLAMAEVEVIRSKYDYLFRLKILDFYQGKDIKL